MPATPPRARSAPGNCTRRSTELPPGQREAVVQLGLREHSLNEASEITGRNTGALKVNLHRALKALRERFHGEP